MGKRETEGRERRAGYVGADTLALPWDGVLPWGLGKVHVPPI